MENLIADTKSKVAQGQTPMPPATPPPPAAPAKAELPVSKIGITQPTLPVVTPEIPRSDVTEYQRPQGQSPQELSDTVFAPAIEQRQQNRDVFNQQQEALVNNITQQQYVPNLYEPPALENTLAFGAAARQNIWQRAAASDRQNAAMQIMAQAAAQQQLDNAGSTSDGLDWIRGIIGQRDKDNPRKYLSPVSYNKATGEYEGNLLGAVLYPLGVIQNTVVGGVLDARYLLRKLGDAMPPWWRNAQSSWLQKNYPGIANSPVVQFLTKENKYDDNRSNIVEALRGAQYSFSDDAGEGVGVGTQWGATSVSVPLSPGWKIPVNPTKLLGFAGDIVLGAKVDKLAAAGFKALGIAPRAAAPIAVAADDATRSAQREALVNVQQEAANRAASASKAKATSVAQSYEQLTLPLMQRPSAALGQPKVAPLKLPKGFANANKKLRKQELEVAKRNLTPAGEQLTLGDDYVKLVSDMRRQAAKRATPQDWRRYNYQRSLPDRKFPTLSVLDPEMVTKRKQVPQRIVEAAQRQTPLPPVVAQNFNPTVASQRPTLEDIGNRIRAQIAAEKAWAEEVAKRPDAYAEYITRRADGQLELPLGVKAEKLPAQPKVASAVKPTFVVGGERTRQLTFTQSLRDGTTPLYNRQREIAKASKALDMIDNAVSSGINNIQWTRNPLADDAAQEVLIDIGKLDSILKKDKGLYVGKGGKGGIGTRYEDAKRFLSESPSSNMIEVVVENGKVTVKDGRHRLAALRDSGVKQVPMLVTGDAGVISKGVVVDTAKRAKQVLQQVPQLPPSPVNDVVNAVAKGKVIKQIAAQTDEAVAQADQAIDATEDIGRKLINQDKLDSLDAQPYDDVVIDSDKLPTVDLAELDGVHGTNVKDLVLEQADPIVGSARHEYGVGHYFFTGSNSESIKNAVNATGKTSDNLPGLATRSFGDPSLHYVKINGKSLRPSFPSEVLTNAVVQLLPDFPKVASILKEGIYTAQIQRASLTFTEILDAIARNVDEESALVIQRRIARMLKNSGISAIHSKKIVSVLNPDAIKTSSVEAVENASKSTEELLAMRNQLEQIAADETGSEFSKAAAADSSAQLAAQGKDTAAQLVEQADQQIQQSVVKSGLLDDIAESDISTVISTAKPTVTDLVERIGVTTTGGDVTQYAVDILDGTVKPTNNQAFRDLVSSLLDDTLDLAPDLTEALVTKLEKGYGKLYDRVADAIYETKYADVLPLSVKPAASKLDDLIAEAAKHGDKVPSELQQQIDDIMNALDDEAFERGFDDAINTQQPQGGKNRTQDISPCE